MAPCVASPRGGAVKLDPPVWRRKAVETKVSSIPRSIAFRSFAGRRSTSSGWRHPAAGIARPGFDDWSVAAPPPGARSRRNRPWRGLWVALVAALMVAVIGCAGGNPPSPASSPPVVATPKIALGTPAVPAAPAAPVAPVATPTPTPAPTAPPTPAMTPSPTPAPRLPACTYADVSTPLTAYDDWALTLLDTTYRVTKSYVPPDLVNTTRAGLGGGNLVRALVIPDLAAMARAAAAAGAPLAILSAYRSYTSQQATYGKWRRILGPSAPLGSARPGHSEHQLGLAIDFESKGGPIPWTYFDWSRDTSAGRWLAANAWQYGFVMSYPANKTKVTCYGYEPWHYRYVGRAEAAAIHVSRLTPRQWLWPWQPQNRSKPATGCASALVESACLS